MTHAGDKQAQFLTALTVLEIADLLMRAGYTDLVVHPTAKDHAPRADILVREGADRIQVVVRAWESASSHAGVGLFGTPPSQGVSDSDRVRRFVRHAYHTQAKNAPPGVSTLVVIRPFICSRDASFAFDEAVLGDGVSTCVETDERTGEVVCRLSRRVEGTGVAGDPAPSNLLAESGIREAVSAACLYCPPYAAPDNACFRLEENVAATIQTPVEMPERLMTAHKIAVLEATDAARRR